MRRPPRAVVVVGLAEDAEAAARMLAGGAREVIVVGEGAQVPGCGGGDLLLVDEWTAETAPHVVAAHRAGADVTVLAELILERFRGRIVAVTGTAGKTSTCHLVAAVLRGAGHDVVMAEGARAGNAWPNHSLADVVGGPDSWLVAELTSTHLCHMARWRGADVGVLTALWADHIELHGSLKRYVASKAVLLERSRVTVAPAGVNPTDRVPDVTFGHDRPAGAGVWVDGSELRAVTPTGAVVDVGGWATRPVWAHPDAVLAACGAGLACGVDLTGALAVMCRAAAPPHRMMVIGEGDGITRIDDAMAATPSKAAAALRSLPVGRVVLVAGGHDRVDGVPVHDSPDERRALAAAVRDAGEIARAIVPFGPAGGVFAALPVATSPRADLTAAIGHALDVARPGDTVLVSPMFPVDQADRAAVADLLASDLPRSSA